MRDLWLVGQIGIGIEAIGAALGVWFAWQTRQEWLRINAGTFGGVGETASQTKKEFIAHFWKQMMAFGLIGLGLILQFIGNFAK